MVAYAQQSIHSALALGDGVVPIRETREPIISALLSCYSPRIAYGGNAPRRERHKLLKKELRAIVEDAATMQGLERRNVVQIHPNGNQLGDIVLASVDGVSEFLCIRNRNSSPVFFILNSLFFFPTIPSHDQ